MLEQFEAVDLALATATDAHEEKRSPLQAADSSCSRGDLNPHAGEGTGF
jgi:hypothetical protein